MTQNVTQIDVNDVKVGDIVVVMYEYPDHATWFANDENAKENPLRGEVLTINDNEVTIGSTIMVLPPRITVDKSKIIHHWKFMG